MCHTNSKWQPHEHHKTVVGLYSCPLSSHQSFSISGGEPECKQMRNNVKWHGENALLMLPLQEEKTSGGHLQVGFPSPLRCVSFLWWLSILWRISVLGNNFLPEILCIHAPRIAVVFLHCIPWSVTWFPFHCHFRRGKNKQLFYISSFGKLCYFEWNIYLLNSKAVKKNFIWPVTYFTLFSGTVICHLQSALDP